MLPARLLLPAHRSLFRQCEAMELLAQRIQEDHIPCIGWIIFPLPKWADMY